MKLAKRLILLLLLVVVGLWLWSVVFPGPEKAIRQHLAQTARAASFPANEGPMDRLSNLGAFAKCFSPDAQVKFESPGGGTQSLAGRDDLMRAAGAARTLISALQVDFVDAILVVAPDRETATVDLTVRATVPGDRDFFVQEMKVYLKKFGRSWLIVRAESVKTLSRTDTPSGSRKHGVEAGASFTLRHGNHSAAKPQPNPRASRLTAEDAKALAKAAKEPNSLRPSASTSASFALKNFVAACEQSALLQCGETRRFEAT